jgi:acid phosphatase type 7
MCFSQQTHAQTVLVPMGATWAFLADGSDQGIAWRAADFDDATWLRGPAQLGYGENDEATTVASGPGTTHFVTTYFRAPFVVDAPTRYANLSGELTYDDGAVVYLNGTEVFRINMPSGEPTFNTLAADSGEYLPVSFTIAASRLRAGVNVVAVEVHQADTTSSDVSFDLRLTGDRPLSPQHPTSASRGKVQIDPFPLEKVT